MTPVTEAVLRALTTVGYGKTITYGELAELSGTGVPARAIGEIMAANPVPILIPCHRVVASDGLGGYSGGEPGRQLETKRWLLEKEVRFLRAGLSMRPEPVEGQRIIPDMATAASRTGCCVVGGGPAGLVLGLILARAGVRTTVLEKHADFLRDFRGDTVHASTLTLLDELGLGERFADLPPSWVEQLTVELDEGAYRVADLSRLPGPHKHIALVPQWDFLNVVADASRQEPSYELIMEAEATDLLWEGPRVTGVTYHKAGKDYRLEADLVVGCDGRSSVVRERAGLKPRRFGCRWMCCGSGCLVWLQIRQAWLVVSHDRTY